MSPEKREFKMNKKCAVLAVAGLVVLTGCTPKIMNQRVYSPSQDGAGQLDNADGKAFGEVPAAENTPSTAPDIAVRPMDGAPAPAPAPAPNYNGFAPMEASNAPAGLSGQSAPKKSSGKKAYAKGGTYVVKSGDTLGGIARRHSVSLGALLEANKMTMQDAKKLTVGRKLVIPAAGKKAAAKTKKGASATPAAAAEKGYYIVQRGDFPQKIARKNKVKLADLLKANNLTMDSARRLQIGQKLIIPGKGAVSTAPAAAETQDAPVEQKPAETVTPVEKADNAAAKIEEAMPVEDNKGTAVVAPSAPMEVGEDISVKDFAAKLKVTEEWLRNENPTLTGDLIKKGDIIMVPGQN